MRAFGALAALELIAQGSIASKTSARCGIARQFDVCVALPADREAVARLLARSYPVLMAESYEPAVLAAALPLMTQSNPALLASGTYFVAVADSGDVIGCGGWTPQRPGADTTVEAGLGNIRHFGTDPGWARLGVGRAIMEATFDSARRRDIRRLDCLASRNAVSFYSALGFLATAEQIVMLGGVTPFPSVAMTRAL